MRTCSNVRLGILATLLILTAPALAGAGRQGPVPGARRATKVAGRHCLDAARAVVSAPAGFDGIRVVVAEALPGAAVDVTVMVGTSDRRVRAWGGGAWSLRMDDAPAGEVLVAIEPSLDSPFGACVERIELLRNEQVVAHVRMP